MAELVAARWPVAWDGPSRRDRRGGRYEAYVPDQLQGRSIRINEAVGARAAAVERSVRALSDGPGSRSLEGLARFLLRSEAISSSRIEGLQVSPQQVALAEFASSEGLSQRGVSIHARLVANNVKTLHHAVGELVDAPSLTVDGVCSLHRALLPADPHPGVRTIQNWIGGPSWNPLDADFVPPPPGHVQTLLEDLTRYGSGGMHAPLIQAGLVHAQFETIHPFTDGNGRVGRALIHTVLARRGVTRSAVLPISLVLLTRSQQYVDGLTAYRYVGPAGGDDAAAGIASWLGVFLDATEIAAEQAKAFGAAMDDLRSGWAHAHQAHRTRLGLRPEPRANSAVARLVALLPEEPLLTARTAQRTLDVSFPAARAALEELADAGVLRRRQLERGTTGYLAVDVFALLTLAERRLASTRWDTRQAPPVRPVAARPPR